MKTQPQIIVVARPGALADAAKAAGMSVYAIAKAITEQHDSPSRATVHQVFARPGYPISKDKAERIAAVLRRPVGALFVHRDGAALA